MKLTTRLTRHERARPPVADRSAGRRGGWLHRVGVSLAVAAVALGSVTAAPAQASTLIGPSPAIAYQTFNGAPLTLVPWVGRNVAVLVPTGAVLTADVMDKVVTALDSAYDYYKRTTGQVPAPFRTVNGRLSIAVVPTGGTCGAGCGYLGSTGIEVEATFFDQLYAGVRDRNAFDQVLFYEMGRNFWFYSPQLQYQSPEIDPIVTGFAVLMRLRSMNAAGVIGDSYDGGTLIPWPQFVAMITGIVDDYEADQTQTWAGTLAQGRSPSVLGGTDFFASIMLRLAGRYGGDTFLARFFHLVATKPASASTLAAVTTMVSASSQAACTDLREVFYTRWSLPRPDGSVTSRTAPAATPMPVAQPCSAVAVDSPAAVARGRAFRVGVRTYPFARVTVQWRRPGQLGWGHAAGVVAGADGRAGVALHTAVDMDVRAATATGVSAVRRVRQVGTTIVGPASVRKGARVVLRGLAAPGSRVVVSLTCARGAHATRATAATSSGQYAFAYRAVSTCHVYASAAGARSVTVRVRIR